MSKVRGGGVLLVATCFKSVFFGRYCRRKPLVCLIRAQLLQVLFAVHSERPLVEQINYNLLYRWFIGLTIDDRVRDHSSFTTNRNRLLENSVIPELFDEVVQLARKHHLLSNEHFSVDGTHIQAWVSHKSFRPKDGDDKPGGMGRNADADFYGEKRTNATHESKADSEALMA